MNMKNDNSQSGDISSVIRDFTVQVYDLDMNHSSTMPVICNYLQEAGITHGMMITADAGIASNDMVFVLTRLNVRMERYPQWKERVSVRTWLSPIKDRYVIRNFEILAKDGEIIGRGINSAVAFDIKNRTGGVVAGDISKVKTLDTECALPHIFEKLSPVTSGEYQNNIDVRYYDCDLYYHVNNVKYIQWCIETLPVEFIRSHNLYEIDINFRAEGNIGDKLVVKTEPGSDEGIFNHSITDLNSGKELVRMKSHWRI